MQNLQCDLCFTSHNRVYERNKHNSIMDMRNKVTWVTRNDFLFKKYVGCFSTVMIRSDVFATVKFKNIKSGQDHNFLLDCLSRTGRAALLPIPLTDYLIRRKSLSSNKIKRIKWQFLIYRKFQKLSLFKSSILLLNWAQTLWLLAIIVVK